MGKVLEKKISKARQKTQTYSKYENWRRVEYQYNRLYKVIS